MESSADSLTRFSRRPTDEVRIGTVGVGGDNPIRLQSMTNTDTNDTEASAAQVERIAAAGGEIVRLTAQGRREAANLGRIRALLGAPGMPRAARGRHPFSARRRPRGGRTGREGTDQSRQLERAGRRVRRAVVDMPPARSRAAHRRQPRFAVALDHGTLRRHGRRHGRLGDGVFAPLPRGVVRTGRRLDQVEQRARDGGRPIGCWSPRCVARECAIRCIWARTEAGDDREGRVKSAVGIGALLGGGIGATIRVSLTEAPEREIPVARTLAGYFAGRENHAPIPDVDESLYSP